jgi:hypothetical protein
MSQNKWLKWSREAGAREIGEPTKLIIGKLGAAEFPLRLETWTAAGGRRKIPEIG